jgi:hypothetical protein
MSSANSGVNGGIRARGSCRIALGSCCRDPINRDHGHSPSRTPDRSAACGNLPFEIRVVRVVWLVVLRSRAAEHAGRDNARFVLVFSPRQYLLSAQARGRPSSACCPSQCPSPPPRMLMTHRFGFGSKPHRPRARCDRLTDIPRSCNHSSPMIRDCSPAQPTVARPFVAIATSTTCWMYSSGTPWSRRP